jgi:iron(III) transport system permease protein
MVRAGSRSAGSAWLPAAVTLVVLALLVLPPLFVLVRTSLTDSTAVANEPTLTLQHFADLFANRRFYVSAWNSLLFSVLTTIIATLAGGTIAWVAARTNARLRGLAYVTAIVSLGTPDVLRVTALLFFLGRSGPVNDLYRTLTGSDGNLFDVYSISGVVLIQSILWLSPVFLLLSTVFQRSNAEMEEAARMCGASLARSVWAISFKLAWPAIAGVALFIFIRNLESFDVPVLVGGPGHVYLLTSDIYLSMTETPPQVGYASAFSLVLIGLLTLLLMYYNRFSVNADRYASVTGKTYRARAFDLGRYRWVGTAIVLGNFLIVLAIPLFVSLWLALMPFAVPIHWSALGMATADNFKAVLGDSHYLTLGLNTIAVAAGAATAATVIAFACGWLVVRRKPGSRAIELLANVPIAFPGIVVGVALLIIALGLPFQLYGTLWIIMAAFLIRFMPYAMRYTHAGVLQIHRELEEAAAVAGASQWRVWTKIVLPLLLPALASGWVFVFLLGANELSMSVLLAGARSQVMAVAMFERWGAGQAVEVFALGLIWSVVMAAVTLTFYVAERRFIATQQSAP